MEFFCCLFGKKGWGSVLKAILDLDFVGRELSKSTEEDVATILHGAIGGGGSGVFFLKESSQLMVNWYLEDHHSY